MAIIVDAEIDGDRMRAEVIYRTANQDNENVLFHRSYRLRMLDVYTNKKSLLCRVVEAACGSHVTFQPVWLDLDDLLEQEVPDDLARELETT